MHGTTIKKGKLHILWNQQIQTNRTIPNNKTDIIIHDFEKGIYVLIDVTVSGDENLIKKEAEKILTCTCFIIVIQPMWNEKEKVITVITGATASISKLIRQYQSNLLGKHEIKELKNKHPHWALYTYFGKYKY